MVLSDEIKTKKNSSFLHYIPRQKKKQNKRDKQVELAKQFQEYLKSFSKTK